MSLEVKGKITKFLDVESVTSKASGSEWKKQSFIVETDEQYNNLYCFEVFGADKVEKLTQYNKVGDVVNVQFNVNTNEWKGRYFTSLQSWRIEKADVSDSIEDNNFETIGNTDVPQNNGDLPF